MDTSRVYGLHTGRADGHGGMIPHWHHLGRKVGGTFDQVHGPDDTPARQYGGHPSGVFCTNARGPLLLLVSEGVANIWAHRAKVKYDWKQQNYDLFIVQPPMASRNTPPIMFKITLQNYRNIKSPKRSLAHIIFD